jgi:hypothetical protein
MENIHLSVPEALPVVPQPVFDVPEKNPICPETISACHGFRSGCHGKRFFCPRRRFSEEKGIMYRCFPFLFTADNADSRKITS